MFRVVFLVTLALFVTFAPGAWAEGPAPVAATATVRVHEREVYVVRAPRAGQSPQERARAAAHALETVLEEGADADARVEEQGNAAVIFVGKTPILTLSDADAEASGDASLHTHAASAATRISEGLRTERKRSAIATRVFSFSLLVFSALIAFLLLRRVGALGRRVRVWVHKYPQRVPAFRLGNIEVVSRASIRGLLSIGLVAGDFLAHVAIVYAWVLFALSLFDSTREYTERLTGFVLTPLSALVGRVGSALPMLVVAGVALLVLGIVVRFAGLFFESVARGETKVEWLPADLAEPTSVLVRTGLVVSGLVLASPIVTGSDEGALSRTGVAALFTIALACTPVLATAASGLPQVFGRRFRPGDFVETGSLRGKVKAVTLLYVELEDKNGRELRVPHLIWLVRPVVVSGGEDLVTAEVSVDPASSQAAAEEALLAAARKFSPGATVELLRLDRHAARYRVTCARGTESLSDAIAEALARGGISLGSGREA